MRKIIVHNPYDIMRFKLNSTHTKEYHRDYHKFFDDLTHELRKKYIVEEKKYENRLEGQNRFDVNIIKKTCSEFILDECEYLIEFEDTGEFYLLSIFDDLKNSTICENDNPFCKKILVSQFIYDKIYHHVKDNIFKYSPWIYFKSKTLDLESFYNKRKEISTFTKKMYFGGHLESRPIIQHFNPSIFYVLNNNLNQEEYFNDMISYLVGFSVGGTAELCYRDIEYMSLGIPFIRFEFLTSLCEPLIPNYHYISIPLDNTLPSINLEKKDRLGGYTHAKKIEARFMEIMNNSDYITFVANNAKKYYDDYLSPENRVKKTLELLNL